MRLTSGPANYERFRSLVIVLLFVGWGCWAFYDWKVGYLKKNHEAARKHLTQTLDSSLIPERLPDHPNEDDIEAVKKLPTITMTELEQRFGPPFAKTSQSEDGPFLYFVSAYGMVAAPALTEAVDPSKLRWTKWDKTKSEVDAQLWWGVAAVGIGLCFVPGMIRAFSLRVKIDDDGMTYAGQRIPFAAMKRFENYSPKGWVDVVYDEAGRERKLRLDDHRVREFNGIIDEIIRAKGFSDPRAGEAG